MFTFILVPPRFLSTLGQESFKSINVEKRTFLKKLLEEVIRLRNPSAGSEHYRIIFMHLADAGSGSVDCDVFYDRYVKASLSHARAPAGSSPETRGWCWPAAVMCASGRSLWWRRSRLYSARCWSWTRRPCCPASGRATQTSSRHCIQTHLEKAEQPTWMHYLWNNITLTKSFFFPMQRKQCWVKCITKKLTYFSLENAK